MRVQISGDGDEASRRVLLHSSDCGRRYPHHVLPYELSLHDGDDDGCGDVFQLKRLH